MFTTMIVIDPLPHWQWNSVELRFTSDELGVVTYDGWIYLGVLGHSVAKYVHEIVKRANGKPGRVETRSSVS